MSLQITELTAVNVAIAASGATPVSSIESTRPDVIAIVALLDSVSREIQADGWWFNREYNITLSPDAQGRIITPQNAISVDPVDTSLTYVQRGQYLYDRTLATFNIGKSVQVDVITYLAWDELPYPAQVAIQYKAAQNFVGGNDGDTDEFVRMRNEADLAMAKLRKADLRNEDETVRRNPMVARIMGRRTNRVTTRFGGAKS